MKTVLIIQAELPEYRGFLWQALRRAFKLYVANDSANILIHPDGSETSFSDYVFSVKVDCLVLNAGIRESVKALRYIHKFRPLSVLGWTQFVGQNKGLLSRIVKTFYLVTVFDKILLYYDHEKRLIPFNSLLRKSVGLNNTIADWPLNIRPVADPRSILFIGRYTDKSKLELLLKAALEVDEIVMHIIGVQRDEVPVDFLRSNIRYYGRIQNPSLIQDIANACTYFVYPGDVGLSIVHAVKLGLIPVVHAELDKHMPECRAVAQDFPILYFQRDDQSSLANILSLIVATRVNFETKQGIASRAQEIFSESVMTSNFINAIEGG